MKKLNHLEEIYNSYDTFIIDLWGVMHNGVKLNDNAIEAIDHLISKNKKIVFLSNAPRPSKKVREFLRKLNMNEKYLGNIMTSGEAAMRALEDHKYGQYFYHLGPKRDDTVFSKIKEKETSLDKADFILCTGLFDEEMIDLNYYKKLLKPHTSKLLICTNPDLTVHRGEVEEYCAGKLAELFEQLGGKVVYFGKPYEEIYKLCFSKNEKALAIGDNLNTDIRGANNMKIDSIFISYGVHRSEFQNENELNDLQLRYKVNATYYQPKLTW